MAAVARAPLNMCPPLRCTPRGAEPPVGASYWKMNLFVLTDVRHTSWVTYARLLSPESATGTAYALCAILRRLGVQIHPFCRRYSLMTRPVHHAHSPCVLPPHPMREDASRRLVSDGLVLRWRAAYGCFTVFLRYRRNVSAFRKGATLPSSGVSSSRSQALGDI